MAKLPNNWLDWVTLIGALSGLISVIKLFVFDRWLNLTQCSLLAAAYRGSRGDIRVFRYSGGGGVDYTIDMDDMNSVHLLIGRPVVAIDDDIKKPVFVGSIRGSYDALIYLDELVTKNYFVLRNTSSTYTLTAKGLRYGRVLRFLIPARRLWAGKRA